MFTVKLLLDIVSKISKDFTAKRHLKGQRLAKKV